jgi:superfamily II DNA or RNA helicase
MSKQLRGWQADALPAVSERIDERPLVRAVMGAGKSVLIAELVGHVPDTLRVVVTTPAVRLVDDLAETIEWWLGLEPGSVGKWYTHEKRVEQITICCNDSLQSLVDSGELGPVEMWVADEAHRTECDSIKRAVKKLDPYRRVGFSATPWRASDSGRLTLFETLAFDYTAVQAIEDGHVVPPRVRHYRGEADTLNEACAEAIDLAVAEKLGPGLANARNIADAHEFAELLQERGIGCATIHSKIDRGLERDRLAALRDGDLDCLVHVDMLAEGVDLPWLRWLCCRRPVGSKVRFAQEVGRVLRAAPGKDHAIIFDPHDLFSIFQLDDKAVLDAGGEVEHDDPVRLPAIQLDFLCTQIREDPEPPETYRGVPVRLIDPVSSYLTKLCLQLQFAGELDPEIKSTHWRAEPPSEKQLSMVRRLSSVLSRTDGIPEAHATALEVATAAAPGLKKGAVSDLIDILMTLRKRRVWPDYIEVAAETASVSE